MMRCLGKGPVKSNVSFVMTKMVTKGNRFLATKGHANEFGVSRLVSIALHMGFLTFSKSDFPRDVLSHKMETYTFSKLEYILTISLTLNYVPTYDSSSVDPPI